MQRDVTIARGPNMNRLYVADMFVLDGRSILITRPNGDGDLADGLEQTHENKWPVVRRWPWQIVSHVLHRSWMSVEASADNQRGRDNDA